MSMPIDMIITKVPGGAVTLNLPSSTFGLVSSMNSVSIMRRTIPGLSGRVYASGMTLIDRLSMALDDLSAWLMAAQRDYRRWKRRKCSLLNTSTDAELASMIAEHMSFRARVNAQLERRNPRP